MVSKLEETNFETELGVIEPLILLRKAFLAKDKVFEVLLLNNVSPTAPLFHIN